MILNLYLQFGMKKKTAQQHFENLCFTVVASVQYKQYNNRKREEKMTYIKKLISLNTDISLSYRTIN